MTTRVQVLAAALVVMTASCSVDQKPPPRPSESSPAASVATHRAASGMTTTPIMLACSDGTTGLTSEGVDIFGVQTGLFGWGEAHWSVDPTRSQVSTVMIGDSRYYMAKSPISVSRDADETTRITLLGPDTALLFYTSWAEWQQFGDPERERNAIEARASRTVVVPRCGDEPWGAPGAVLLESPDVSSSGSLARTRDARSCRPSRGTPPAADR